MDDISSASPTPGGGNVSAFSGAMACSLGIMVCNLTIGKKKYADVESEIADIRTRLETNKTLFLELAEKDNKAFDTVMEAFKLPKETDEQKKSRTAEIEKATILAASVPAEVLKNCNDTLLLLETLSRKGNRNSLSDAGVAISLLETAAQGAYLNVLINYSSLSDKSPAESIYNSANADAENVKNNSRTLLDNLQKELNK